MNAPRFSRVEKDALLTFYRATGAGLRADYLEKGWLPWAAIDRETLNGICAAHDVLVPMKVAA